MFWKADVRHETASFGQTTQIQKILLFQQQKHKNMLKPLFL